MNLNRHVPDRLVRVMHYVNERDVKPKKGVNKNDGVSVHMSMVKPTCREFEYGIAYLNLLVSELGKEGSCLDSGREMKSRIEQVVKKIEEMLSSGKAVSEANGFVREEIEWKILGLWKSLFGREAKEARLTLKVIKYRIFTDVFLPVVNGLAQLAQA